MSVRRPDPDTTKLHFGEERHHEGVTIQHSAVYCPPAQQMAPLPPAGRHFACHYRIQPSGCCNEMSNVRSWHRTTLCAMHRSILYLDCEHRQL